MIRAGMKKNTASMEKRIDLQSTSPKSFPILNCMNTSATIPDMVVRELDDISIMALLKAVIIASLASSPLSCSSIYLWNRMMA